MKKLFPALLLASFLSMNQAAMAQSIVARGGEHPSFSRVVLTTPPNTDWSLSGSGQSYQITFASAQRFNLRELFERIPRDRLSSVSVNSSGQSLELELGCDCSVNAWQERPRLIVIDILDAPLEDGSMSDPLSEAEVNALPLAEQETPGSFSPVPIETAQSIGAELASRLQPTPPSQIQSQAPMPPAMLEELARPFAQALGQGVLEPDVHANSAVQSLLQSDHGASQPTIANVQVNNAVAPHPETERLSSETMQTCEGTAELDEILHRTNAHFNSVMGATSLELFGEFDQPNPQAHFKLVQLYLASGFGAEARTLIENMPEPIPARDLLLGLSDLLEDRNSNSRMRLAQTIGCGGSASAVAALAGANARDVEQHATEIVLAFSRFPQHLQSVLGTDMIQHLLDANSIDRARMVAEGLRRSNWVTSNTMLLIDTRLDRARGRDDDALSRMLFFDANDLHSYQERLDIALETNGDLTPETIADIEATATTSRHNRDGQELMATLVETLTNSGEFQEAFQALDRLETWLESEQLRERILEPLKQHVWEELITKGTNLEFATEVLRRSDWQGTSLPQTTRDAMALRMATLGLENAAELLTADHESRARANDDEALRRPSQSLSAPTLQRNGSSAPQVTSDALRSASRETEAVPGTNTAFEQPDTHISAEGVIHYGSIPPPVTSQPVSPFAPASGEQLPHSRAATDAATTRLPRSTQADPSISNESAETPTNPASADARPTLAPATTGRLSSDANPTPETRRGLLHLGTELLAQSGELRTRLETMLSSD